MEKIKNFLVVLLSLTMCLLCFATLIVMSGSEISLRSILKDEIEYESGKTEKTFYKNMAIPYRISVVTGGTVYTEQGVSRTSQFFKDCEKLLLEAVGSMLELEECSLPDYNEAIGSKSLIFTLNGKLPLYLMQMWSGSVDGYENQTSTVALVRESKGIKVYFRDDGGKCYRSQTSSANAVIDELIANHTGSNGILENGTVFSENTLKAMSYQINENKTGLDENKVEDVLKAYGFNPYFAQTYQEPDGDKVYIEEDDVLSVSADGSMVYRSSESGIILKDGGSVTEHESVALAVNKLGEISGLLYAEHPEISADVVSVEKNDDEIHIGSVIKLNGIPISEDVCSAGVIVKNGSIVRMWIDVPSVIELEMKTLMSDTMAKAVSGKKDSRFELIYIMEEGQLVPVNSFVE
ncbi:MAG: hypothetical protein IJO16_00375 [Clostridia bacterium]|nr:hypothetical protein [Clostridia bacterium]